MKRTSIFPLFLLAFVFWGFNSKAQDSLRMNAGQRLDKGQKIEIAGKGYLIMQTDGNLVFYNAANQPKWASGTNGKAATHAIMQTDGNLCIYNNSTYVWDAKTAGLNANYFQIDVNTYRVTVHKADKTLAKELAPGNSVRFPRQQNWESQVLYALGTMPGYLIPINPINNNQPYSALPPLEKALGTHALAAAEGVLIKTPNLTPAQAVNEIQAKPDVRNKILGVMGMLVIDHVLKGGNDASTVALRDWVTQIYRHMKIQSAKGSLEEYKKWKANPCAYAGEGYVKPVSCGSTSLVHSMFEVNMPPSDLIGKAGMQYATADAPAIVGGISTAFAGMSLFAITNALGSALSAPGVALFFALTPGMAGTEYAAFGLIGATGWAGVAAAPIAVVTFAATMGLAQGLLIYEAKMVEVRLKQAVGAAISEPINIVNALSDKNGAMMFLFGFMKTANYLWTAPSLATAGEVTFRCDAGFFSKFVLTYNLNGQNVTNTTQNLPLDGEQAFPIPADATNIVAKGYMISAGEHLLFTQGIPKPTYTMFKTYNTIFNPSWANAWPLKVPGFVKLVHDGGYVIKYEVNCVLDGKSHTATKEGITAGMVTTFTLPENAKNIRIRAWGATGLAWEPWRQTFDFSYPEPPGMCIKTYGTTLDQKWATDCD
ncbi:MAG: hypothetical protein H6577_20700 [Lewinellaceae bacterium]|nr:hypothetical protein [Saprospiraceae bacterium]MCB9340551.1 hypothetical protein [Lewinellaceae bacterium]